MNNLRQPSEILEDISTIEACEEQVRFEAVE
jgi:hypothetical protein